jgi:hypothetical protein
MVLSELPSLADLESPPLTAEHKKWEVVGSFYLDQKRFHDALAIYSKLYDHLLAAQDAAATWYTKGTPLVWMSECYAALGCTTISQRYLMLAYRRRDRGPWRDLADRKGKLLPLGVARVALGCRA